MSISSTAAATSGPSTIAQTVTATSANTFYAATLPLGAGTYTVTCVSSTIAEVEFWNGNTLLTTAITSSGTVTVNLGSACTRISYFTNTGSNILVNIQLVGQAIVSGISGTLDTLTSTQTYTQTGAAYVVVVGGGGGGGANGSGGGGGSGGITGGALTLTGSMSVTVGAAGVGGTSGGGASTIGSYTANGGGLGGSANGTSSGQGVAGTPGGGNGGWWQSQNSVQPGVAGSSSPYPMVKSGTTGGGGAGGNSGTGAGSSGAGSGIGTGGTGGNYNTNTPATAATGYGAGGGGDGRYNGVPGSSTSGTQGVVYVLRF